jgi:hypothetical protein
MGFANTRQNQPRPTTGLGKAAKTLYKILGKTHGYVEGGTGYSHAVRNLRGKHLYDVHHETLLELRQRDLVQRIEHPDQSGQHAYVKREAARTARQVQNRDVQDVAEHRALKREEAINDIVDKIADLWKVHPDVVRRGRAGARSLLNHLINRASHLDF